MEFPSIYSGAKLAKCAENEALLARLAASGLKPSQLSPDEFRAYLAAAIDRARVPWERGKDHSGHVVEPDDDDDLIEPPAPPQPAPVPRRQRKRSLAKVIAAARKAGADRIVVDGTTIMLSPAAAVPESDASDSDANEWDAVLPGGDHGPH